MATINLGRVQPIDRGSYTSSATYKKLDFITSADGLDYYTCILNAPQGTPLTNTTYFRKAISSPTDVIINSILKYETLSGDGTASAPTNYGEVVVDFTGATGTVTLPPLPPAGGRVLIKKRNPTMGSVNINTQLGDPVSWGTAQLRLYSNQDFWELISDGVRWCVEAGFETGTSAAGDWRVDASGKAHINATVTATFASSSTLTNNWTYPIPLIAAPTGSPQCSIFAGSESFSSVSLADVTQQTGTVGATQAAIQCRRNAYAASIGQQFVSGDTVDLRVTLTGEKW